MVFPVVFGQESLFPIKSNNGHLRAGRAPRPSENRLRQLRGPPLVRGQSLATDRAKSSPAAGQGKWSGTPRPPPSCALANAQGLNNSGPRNDSVATQGPRRERLWPSSVLRGYTTRNPGGNG